jgi:D-alanine-D-alanine ligase
VVHDAKNLMRQIRFVAQRYGQPALVEVYVGEREFNVSILGNDPPVVLPTCEIDYSLMPEGMPKIVGFAAKWFPQSPEYRGSMPVCPAPVAAALQDQVQKTALAAYRACGLRDYGRIDLRWDGKNHPTVIDVNPNPAISPDSGYCLSAHKAGMEHADLVEKIARLALIRA